MVHSSCPPPHPPTHTSPTQGRCADLKAELRALLLKHGVKSMRVVPVKRRYAFEDASIPHGEQWVLKVGARGGGVWLFGGSQQGAGATGDGRGGEREAVDVQDGGRCFCLGGCSPHKQAYTMSAETLCGTPGMLLLECHAIIDPQTRLALPSAVLPQVRYPASEPALPPGLTGQHFRALTGVRSVSLETLLLKRGLKGPGWLALDVQEWRSGSGMVRACQPFSAGCPHAVWLENECKCVAAAQRRCACPISCPPVHLHCYPPGFVCSLPGEEPQLPCAMLNTLLFALPPFPPIPNLSIHPPLPVALVRSLLPPPAWLHHQVSWCKREVVLSSPKALSPAAPGTPLAARPPPPLTVASLSLRVHTTAASNHSSEILAASVVHLSGENGWCGVV